MKVNLMDKKLAWTHLYLDVNVYYFYNSRATNQFTCISTNPWRINPGVHPHGAQSQGSKPHVNWPHIEFWRFWTWNLRLNEPNVCSRKNILFESITKYIYIYNIKDILSKDMQLRNSDHGPQNSSPVGRPYPVIVSFVHTNSDWNKGSNTS